MNLNKEFWNVKQMTMSYKYFEECLLRFILKPVIENLWFEPAYSYIFSLKRIIRLSYTKYWTPCILTPLEVLLSRWYNQELDFGFLAHKSVSQAQMSFWSHQNWLTQSKKNKYDWNSKYYPNKIDNVDA